MVEESNYYPFGLKHQGYNNNSNILTDKYKYGYNGKEEQEELGLNWNDYGARNYDPAFGRWMNVDPMMESREWLSPFNYVQNNPLLRIDPNGALDDIWEVLDDNTLRMKEENDDADTVVDQQGNTIVQFNEDEAVENFVNGKGTEKVTVLRSDGESEPSNEGILEVPTDNGNTPEGTETFFKALSNTYNFEISNTLGYNSTGESKNILTTLYNPERVGTTGINMLIGQGYTENIKHDHSHPKTAVDVFGIPMRKHGASGYSPGEQNKGDYNTTLVYPSSVIFRVYDAKTQQYLPYDRSRARMYDSNTKTYFPAIKR